MEQTDEVKAKITRRKKKVVAVTVEDAPAPVAVEAAPAEKPCSAVKRMVETLDRFLTRRIMSIAVLYMFSMIGLGVILLANGVTSNASNGDAVGYSNVQIWLNSIICTLTFIFLLVLVRVVMVQVFKRKKD